MQDNLCQQYELSIWDLTTQKLVGALQGYFDAISFSPDSKFLTVRGCRTEQDNRCQEYELSVLDMTAQKLGDVLLKIQGNVSNAVISLDSKMLAYSICTKEQDDGKCIEHEIHLWETATRQEINEQHPTIPADLGDLVFSPKGNILVDASDVGTFLLDVQTHSLLGERLAGRVSEHPYWLKNIRGFTEDGTSYPFTSDGKFLVLIGRDEYWERQFLMFDMVTLQLSESLTGRSLGLELAELALSPDGRTLVSFAYRGPSQIWDMATKKQIGALIEPNGGIFLRSYFSPDGNTLFSYSNTSGDPFRQGYERVMLLGASDIAWIHRACRTANRNLSFDEWNQYVKSGEETWDEYVKNPTCPDLPIEPLATPTPTPSPTP